MLGIQLDDNNDADPNTNTLLFANRVGWGSSQGFADLTSASTATASHLHGPTTGVNGGGGFTQTAGVFLNLTRSSSAVTGGVFTNDLPFTAAQVAQLNDGKFYINLHTSANTGGEMRAFLVPTAVPEPGTLALLVGGACAAFAFRKRYQV